MDWQKSYSEKDIIYYFRHREMYGIFTIDDNISDNLIQINIKFRFTLYEYITAYESTLCFLFIGTLPQHIHTLVTLVSHSHNFFMLVLLDHCH